MTVDLTEFYEAANRKCVVAKKAETLGENEREKFEAALDEPSITTSVILRWANERLSDKYQISQDSIYRHRNRTCTCRG